MANSGSQEHLRSGKWETVATFSEATVAHLAKLQLDDAGIPCYLDNENTGTTLWYAQPAVGGIELRVPAPFLEQAQEALETRNRVLDAQEQGQDAQDDDEDREELDAHDTDSGEVIGETSYDEDDGSAGTNCPACHSPDIVPFSWGRRAGQALIVLFLGMTLGAIHIVLIGLVVGLVLYLLLVKPDYRCLRCGKRWIVSDRHG